MEKVIVTIEATDKNLSAFCENLPGCVAVGKNLEELMFNMKEAVKGHLEVTLEYDEDIPDIFKRDYEFVFKFDTGSFIRYWRKTYTLSALGRITGISEKQLQTYIEGTEPRESQKKRIIEGIRKAGKELLYVELY